MATRKRHKHYVEMACPFQQTYCTRNGLTSAGCGICESYVRGVNAPNYPVPAIHFDVEFSPCTPPALIDVYNGPWLLWSRKQGKWV